MAGRIPNGKAFVLVALIFTGSLLMALAVPAAAIWALSHISSDRSASFFIGLIGVPLAVVAWATILGRLNQTYLNVTGRRESDVLGTSLAVAIIAAVILLLILMIFFNSPDQSELGPLPT